MNAWSTLPESYQQRVHKITLATVTRQIQQAVNPTPAVVINREAARVANSTLLDYLTSEVALEEPAIRSTDSNIAIYNNWTDNEMHFGMPRSSGDYEDEGHESDERDVISTTTQQWRPATELKRMDLGTRDVDGYEGEDGDDADTDWDEEEEASQADE